MTRAQSYDLFLACPPGLEATLAVEAAKIGLDAVEPKAGGVEASGDMQAIWRANLHLRGATRVLVRLAHFSVSHLAQLDKRAHAVEWRKLIAPGTPITVEAVCKKSKIYHSGAAAERIERAARDALGKAVKGRASVKIMARIDHNLCTLSVDSSGEPLHKRGFKLAVGKAPMRETLAANFLAECGFDGAEPVLDPMCGSGTFVIEAAEIAAGLAPGRARDFALESFANFDQGAWDKLRATATQDTSDETPVFYGFDRDAGAIRAAGENAERAGVDARTQFINQPLTKLRRPDGPAGLVIVNPPYGARIGNKGALRGLYTSFGDVMRDQFKGWRIGLITSEDGLARATGLPFKKPRTAIPHGDLRIKLYKSKPL